MPIAWRIAIIAALATAPFAGSVLAQEGKAGGACFTASNGQKRCATTAYSTTVKSDQTTFPTVTTTGRTGTTVAPTPAPTNTPNRMGGCRPGQPCITR